uniref:Uncharacterized protein n=1 Tax=Oryza barthii TaxID=65489 RepID=A0A0D3HRS4_9ORYZ
MAPIKINKIIAATFFMVLVVMSCALTSTLACQGGTECTVETPATLHDGFVQCKMQGRGHQPQVQQSDC